ncbi:hypothetical protein SAMN04488540_12425 [Ferrimonas sediminum]|uniref:Uncharacterized protein n=1 Tax=Ferrimonas sediminum TaxID=718193 RepID=A0A1G9AMC5_9GAMM|nr:hypothetical protein [Ferrimonas sediminum]SDK28383.1 hypothetical protein SAMN04488540_12425 [Ferrimonas sediminum]
MNRMLNGAIMVVAGVLLGISATEVSSFVSSQPVELINSEVRKVSSSVESDQQALMRELDKLTQLQNPNPELSSVVNNIQALASRLSANLSQVSYFTNTIESNFLWLAEKERLAQINSFPDFILPKKKAASLCGDDITFSVTSEFGSRITTSLAGRRANFEVGDEAIFESDGERAKLAYLGKADGYYQFRLICSLV